MPRHPRSLRADAIAEQAKSEYGSDLDIDSFQISPEVVKVHIGQLRIAESPRLNGVDPDHARALAEVDDTLPPIIVHHPTMRVIDGMHRLEAARMNERLEIDVRFFHGDWADAFRLAVRANAAHGLPLTRNDRKAAAARILQDQPQLSDRSVAHTTGLAAKTVARIRRQSGGEADRRIGRDGRARPLSTADGRRIALLAISARPEASLRQIAQEAGISVGTVRAVRACIDAGEDPVLIYRRSLGPASSNGNGGSAAHGDPNLVDVDAVIAGLRRDPSLRYTERGRVLLRCLGGHVMMVMQLQNAIDGVPPHCAALVAKVVRGCADELSSIAAALDQRGRGFA